MGNADKDLSNRCDVIQDDQVVFILLGAFMFMDSFLPFLLVHSSIHGNFIDFISSPKKIGAHRFHKNHLNHWTVATILWMVAKSCITRRMVETQTKSWHVYHLSTGAALLNMGKSH